MKRLFTTMLLCMLLVGIPAWSRTYYVSPNGTDDPASGSAEYPFKTIYYAAQQVAAGDIVLLKAGTYTEKTEIKPVVSGSVTRYIVFKPEPEAKGKVIIQGARFDLEQRNYIWIEGLRFEAYELDNDIVNLGRGTGNVVINNTFKNIVAKSFIRLRESIGNTIRNNRFEGTDGQIFGVQARSYRNLITENTMQDTKGIAIGVQETYPERETQTDGDNVFAFNYFNKIAGNAFWFDRNGSGNVLIRNEAYAANVFCFNESRCVRNWVYENIGANLNATGIESAGYMTGHTFDARYVNNVIYDCNYGLFMLNKTWFDEARNNIFFKTSRSGTSARFTAIAKSHGPYIFNNNLWWEEGSKDRFNYLDQNISYEAYADSVGEVNGLYADPQFIDVANHDFTLQPGSPALKAGDNGRDLGAYPIYPRIPVGQAEADSISGDTWVSFDEVISPSGSCGLSVKRGTTLSVKLRLNKMARTIQTVDVIPVAGDCEEGVDFRFVNGRTVTFTPGKTSENIEIEFLGQAQHEQVIAFRLANATGTEIGGKNLHVVRVGKTIYAGCDQLVVMPSDAELMNVQLEAQVYGVASTDVEWVDENGERVATGISTQAALTKGSHVITAKVKNGDKVYTDHAVVRVVKNADMWLEAECGVMGSYLNVGQDGLAGGRKYVKLDSKTPTPEGAFIEQDGHMAYHLNVKEDGFYRLHVRVRSVEANRFPGVTMYSKFDDADFKDWSLGPTNGWTWLELSNSYYLTKGAHVFTVSLKSGYIDKILITNSGTVPDSRGEDGINVGPLLGNLSVNKGILTPAFNPDVTRYTVAVDNTVEQIMLRADANQGTTVDGGGVKTLAVGENIFAIDVTSGEEMRTYTVNVARLNQSPSQIVIDFETDTLGTNYVITKNNALKNTVKNTPVSTAVVRKDPAGGASQVLNIGAPRISTNDAEGLMAKQANVFIQNITMPGGTAVKNLTNVTFDLYISDATGRSDLMRIGLNELGGSRMTEYREVWRSPNALYLGNEDPYAHADRGERKWSRGKITVSLTDLLTKLPRAQREDSVFTFVLGSASITGNYFIDNIVFDIDNTAVNDTIATLSSLGIEGGKLSADFDSKVTHYEATIPAGASTFKINAQATSNQAVVLGAGTHTFNGDGSTYPVQVFAQDGTLCVYTLTVSQSTDAIHETDANGWRIAADASCREVVIEAEQGAWITLCDVQGRVLMRKQARSQQEVLPMQGYAAGVYQLVVTNGTKRLQKSLLKASR